MFKRKTILTLLVVMALLGSMAAGCKVHIKSPDTPKPSNVSTPAEQNNNKVDPPSTTLATTIATTTPVASTTAEPTATPTPTPTPAPTTVTQTQVQEVEDEVTLATVLSFPEGPLNDDHITKLGGALLSSLEKLKIIHGEGVYTLKSLKNNQATIYLNKRVDHEEFEDGSIIGYIAEHDFKITHPKDKPTIHKLRCFEDTEIFAYYDAKTKSWQEVEANSVEEGVLGFALLYEHVLEIFGEASISASDLKGKREGTKFVLMQENIDAEELDEIVLGLSAMLSLEQVAPPSDANYKSHVKFILSVDNDLLILHKLILEVDVFAGSSKKSDMHISIVQTFHSANTGKIEYPKVN